MSLTMREAVAAAFHNDEPLHVLAAKVPYLSVEEGPEVTRFGRPVVRIAMTLEADFDLDVWKRLMMSEWP